MIIGFDGRLANDTHRVGVGQYCFEVLKAIEPLLKKGEKIIVYLDKEPKDFFPVKPSEKIHIKVLGEGRFWTNTILPKTLKKEPPNVFFSPSLQIPWF